MTHIFVRPDGDSLPLKLPSKQSGFGVKVVSAFFIFLLQFILFLLILMMYVYNTNRRLKNLENQVENLQKEVKQLKGEEDLVPTTE